MVCQVAIWTDILYNNERQFVVVGGAKMLIKCKECNKEFSDKAECCPNCGCPISQMDFSNYCLVNNNPYDFSNIMELLPRVGDKDTDVSPIYVAGLIRRKTQLDWNYAKQLADLIIQTQSIPEQFEGVLEINYEPVQENVPRCPTCGSTRIKPISAAERATSIIGFGILSKKINKTYKCLNCKYTW